jgi:Ca-activated chloride channel family protein
MIPLLLVLLAPSQERGELRFRITTDVVPVDVFVGENGRAVPGLDVADFELYDDGAHQTVDAVRIEALPLNVFLVLDTSFSVAGPHLTHLQAAARAFLEEMTEDDRAALVTFSHHLSLASGLTRDVASLQRDLLAVEAEGATSWHDALFAALEMLEPVRERPMVLLFTDGADTYSWLSEDQMVPMVRRSNAVVYAITRAEEPWTVDMRTTRGRARMRAARRDHAERTRLLRQITSESGGRLLETASTERLGSLFLEILAEMKTRYVLFYRPPEPIREGWHEIEVRVKRRGAEVRARRGYYYEATP